AKIKIVTVDIAVIGSSLQLDGAAWNVDEPAIPNMRSWSCSLHNYAQTARLSSSLECDSLHDVRPVLYAQYCANGWRSHKNRRVVPKQNDTTGRIYFQCL